MGFFFFTLERLTMTNEKWQRWTYATFAKSILADIAAASVPYPIVVEFFNPKRTPTWEDATTNGEVTISGPRTRTISASRTKAFVDIFVVITSNITNNNYVHLNAVGEMVKALDKCFLVMDYGDTGALEIGTFKLTDEAEGIDTTHLKPAKEDTQLHSTILARYQGSF